jgi:hypothetical protein
MLAGSHICVGFAPSVHGSCHAAASHHQESNQLSHYRGWGMGRWGAPLRDHLWQGPPVTRNAEIDPGDNDPPPKMTQGVMTPPNPPSSPSTASLSGVARCWHSNAYFSLFLRYFASTQRTDLSRFRGTFIVSILLALLFSLFLSWQISPASRRGSRLLTNRLAAAVAISIPSRPLTSSWSTLQWRYSRSNLNWIQLEGSTSQCLPKVPMSS